ncbi:MAG: hypothetical protein CMJ58_05040 [Planctomycetaceae bacterium]|nr:hypothetical protein [Planctomycetaceae bacterium]
MRSALFARWSLPLRAAAVCLLAATACWTIGRAADSQGANDEAPVDLPAADDAEAEECEISPAAARTAAALAAIDKALAQPPVAYPLPRPSTMAVRDFEKILFRFLLQRRYIELGWKRDKGVRDTGPFINNTYYGTHPAVRVFYSPGVIEWLENGRVGAIPDGEMIIKEQYPEPAARHEGKSEEELRATLKSWTVMVKDAAGSHDGWFWSEAPATGETIDNHQSYGEAWSGFGLYCIRCHAATQSPGVTNPADRANEFTFSALRNIEGYPGEPLLFRVDDSWREFEEPAGLCEHDARAAERNKPAAEAARDAASLIPADVPAIDDVAKIPPLTYDSVTNRADSPCEMYTSNQCFSCHGGLSSPLGVSAFAPKTKPANYGTPGVNVSPYGEWRWTPMGLAGRDPVFYAQLESEGALFRRQFGEEKGAELHGLLQDACLRCHGAMGRHQFHVDHAGEGLLFSVAAAMEITAPGAPLGTGAAKYGALAREGIGCMVCHRMQPVPREPGDERSQLAHFLETSITGRYQLGPPGEIYGPYKDDDIAAYAMHHGLGIKPKHDPYIQSSQMCGTCHTVVLPVVDNPFAGEHLADEIQTTMLANQPVEEFQGFHHHIEQATYLEWLNSEYNNEGAYADRPTGRSCQDCHMGAGLDEGDLADDAQSPDFGPADTLTRIAAIQDTTYPDAENLAPHKDLNVKVRKNHRRHHFAGVNVFLLEMFRQFDRVLGVRKTDYMTGSEADLDAAIARMVRTARRDTAKVSIATTPAGPQTLEAAVTVENLTGHRFPSGVGFRRAWLEVVLVETQLDGSERIVWGSGRTDGRGAIVGRDGRPLNCEAMSHNRAAEGQTCQPHYELIERENQVQIYETLLHNGDGVFTTSFVRGHTCVKDNRLLPRGWRADGGESGLYGPYLGATQPQGEADHDPDFLAGNGVDTTRYRIPLPEGVPRNRLAVRATLYYQSMPPYFLQNLFTTAPHGEATQRLKALVYHLQLEGTPIEGWKLKIGEATGLVE